MENSPQGSFIPKRSTGKVASRRTSKRIYIFSYIAYAFFFGTLLSVVGIFLLTQQAESRLEARIQALAEARNTFDRNDMSRVITLSSQLLAADEILNAHLAPSRIFDELEEVIIKNIQLGGLEYVRAGSGLTVTFTGAADTFDALLFQRDVMRTSDIFSAAEVSGVTYGSETIEAVGASARSPIAAVTTDAKISFSFSDASLRDKIGYTSRQVTFDQSPEPTTTAAESGTTTVTDTTQ